MPVLGVGQVRNGLVRVIGIGGRGVRRLVGRRMNALMGVFAASLMVTSMGLLAVKSGGGAIPTTINYGDLELVIAEDGSSVTVWYDDYWALNKGDLKISYGLDMSGIVTTGMWWDKSLMVKVGVHMNGNIKGWMDSSASFALDDDENDWDYTGDGIPDPELDMDDNHILQAPGKYDASMYDVVAPELVVGPPIGTNPNANYGMWFDRDGVNPWQDTDPTTPAPGGSGVFWGVGDGVTYNTQGLYDMEVNYHMLPPVGVSGAAAMFANVNGVHQGIYQTAWYDGQPENFPVGMKFSCNNMNKLALFVTVERWGGSYGVVKITDLTVTGILRVIDASIDIKPGSYPNSVCLKDQGLLPVAILGSEQLDVQDICPDTIVLGMDPCFVDLATRGPAKAPKLAFSYEDVDGDGKTDMMVFFSVQDLVACGALTAGSTELSLWAELVDGMAINGMDILYGEDSVNPVP